MGKTAEKKWSAVEGLTERRRRKLAETALEVSRTQISAVMNSTKDFIWSVDPERFGLLTWNKAFRDYFSEHRGIEIEVGMTPEELVPPDYVSFWHGLFSRALREEFVVAEYVVVAKTITLLLSLHIMRRNHRVFGISVFGRDITELKQAEKDLLRSEERFRDVAENVSDFIWEVTPEGLYTYTSPSVERLLGYRPEELIGKKHFYDLFAPEVREELKAAALRVFTMKQTFRAFQNANIKKDGETVYLETSGIPMLDEAGNLTGYRGADTDVTRRKKTEDELKRSYAEIARLKDKLEAENIYLREEVSLTQESSKIIGISDPIKHVLYRIAQVAPMETTVLIVGETGTGKGMVARAIHESSLRKGRPMIHVNCAALPPTLIESELFGREKGAFTGALTRMAGRFEVADGSTLFLDEIGELPLEVQAKLLRVIEDGTFERLGSTKALHVDVRLIAATNRDLAREAEGGRFRNDLFYRLNVFPIVIAPLRERPEDIPLLVWAFVNEFQKKMGKRIDNIPKKTMDALQSYEWPGNGRELRNVIERAMIVSSGKTLEVVLPETAEAVPSWEGGLHLEEIERRYIISVLKRTSWHVTGKGGAAEILGLKGTTLQSKMKKLGIKRPASS